MGSIGYIANGATEATRAPEKAGNSATVDRVELFLDSEKDVRKLAFELSAGLAMAAGGDVS
jgi:hypothetical protein